MSTYRQIYYHIVFAPKHRTPAINCTAESNLYNYIGSVIKSLNSQLLQANGMEDHLHLLTDLHPGISLSNFVKEIKVASSLWMKRSGLFPAFYGWQDGYGAFTISEKEKAAVSQYIINQKIHHRKENYESEYKRLLKEYNISFDDRYLF